MNRNYGVQMGRGLRAMFPEQTKSIPAILLWLMVFLADVALVFWLAGKLGIDILSMSYKLAGAVVMIYVAVAGVLFWLETVVYNKIVSLFR